MEKIKEGLGNVINFYKKEINKLNTKVLTDIKVGEILSNKEEKNIRILSGKFFLKLSDGVLIIKNKLNNKRVEIDGVKKVVFRENYIEVFVNTDNTLGIKTWTWNIDYKKLFTSLK